MIVKANLVYDVLLELKKRAMVHRIRKEKQANGFNPMLGICGNFEKILEDIYYPTFHVYQVMGDTYKGWAVFSGRAEYPIPDPEHIRTPKDKYIGTMDMWVGEYGNLRMEFLNYLLQQALAMGNKKMRVW